MSPALPAAEGLIVCIEMSETKRSVSLQTDHPAPARHREQLQTRFVAREGELLSDLVGGQQRHFNEEVFAQRNAQSTCERERR